MRISTRPSGFSASNATLAQIIRDAYRTDGRMLREDEIAAGPRWVYRDRFDIIARSAADVSVDEIRQMVQALLEQRFGLVVSREDREQELYVLRLAFSDGRLGPDLRRAATDCDLHRSSATAVNRLPVPSNGARPSLAGACQPIATLVTLLQGTLNATVTDQTGLSGAWDFVVAHSGLQPRPPGAIPDDRPTLSTALREQLGLRLDRTRGLAKVLVVHSVHPPTEN